jgi:transcription elongation factor GreB
LSSPNYITPSGLARLKQEFEELFYKERPKLVETIAWAASNGDRSENGDYIYGKRRLRQIDSRLKFLRDRIEAAQVVDPKNQKSEVVVFGAIVEVEHDDGSIATYQIVGEDELNPSENKISWRSPVAKALIGKSVDDETTVKAPKGEIELVIKSIRFS